MLEHPWILVVLWAHSVSFFVLVLEELFCQAQGFNSILCLASRGNLRFKQQLNTGHWKDGGNLNS